jgi:hypothetical protein
MMKKIIVLVTVSLMVSLLACSSSKKKTDEPAPAPKPVAVDHSVWVKASNTQLTKVPVDGFEYKGTTVPAQKWDKWAAVSAPVIKKIVDEMPDGYVLQIKGHTDARGPEEPQGDKPGNIAISRDRAKAVLDSLARQGITSKKMTHTGVGSSELKPGAAPRSPEQRRVTFSIVKN